jgi:SagB-type dehydrogenase family enzyme
VHGRIELPSPSYRGTRTLEEALAKRRSNRAFLDRPIEFAAVGQILWAGQGRRAGSGGRTAPSPGGRYPLDLYVVTADGMGLYIPDGHVIEGLYDNDLREGLYAAALFQESIRLAPLVIVITVDFERAENQDGAGPAERFALLEAGHVAQNILLQAYAMGLAGEGIASFKDEGVIEALHLPAARPPLYIIAIGYSRG